MKEELREVIVDGKVIPGYYVSNFGNVYGIPLSRSSDGRWYRNLSSDYKLLKPNAKKIENIFMLIFVFKMVSLKIMNILQQVEVNQLQP